MFDLHYRPGYKYQVSRDYVHALPWYDGETVAVPFVVLRRGELRVFEGYAWDGPSGPTFDTPSFMRGSLVHDALYQLIRAGVLHERYRLDADRELRSICRAAGMSALRAWWVYWAVRFGAGFAARTGADGGHPERSAP